eukprot:gene17371-23582_t
MPTSSAPVAEPPLVRRFHQSLLWPLRLLPVRAGGHEAGRQPWQQLGEPWQAIADEYTGASTDFHERHYQEFVTFLPYVQRFLYGEGRASRLAGARPGAA